MTRNRQRVTDYLGHIREAIERIDRYVADIDEMVFLQNEMAQDAVIRNFEIIGEASHNIEQDHPGFAVEHPELPLGVRLPDAQCCRSRLLQGRPGNRLEDHPQ